MVSHIVSFPPLFGCRLQCLIDGMKEEWQKDALGGYQENAKHLFGYPGSTLQEYARETVGRVVRFPDPVCCWTAAAIRLKNTLFRFRIVAYEPQRLIGRSTR